MGKKLFCGIIDLHGKGLAWLGSFHLKWSSKLRSQNWKVHYPKGTRGGLGGEVQLVLTKCWSIMAIVANCNNFQDINSFWPSASKSSFFKFHLRVSQCSNLLKFSRFYFFCLFSFSFETWRFYIWKLHGNEFYVRAFQNLQLTLVFLWLFNLSSKHVGFYFVFLLTRSKWELMKWYVYFKLKL